MALEDFTTYTKIDPGGKLTVATNKITAVNADMDEANYVYKDFTADHFDALNVDFEILIDSAARGNCWGGIAFANMIGGLDGAAATDIFVAGFQSSGGAFSIYLGRGWITASDSYAASADTVYYCTLARAASSDSVELTIYSDSGRTDLLDTLTVSGLGTERWQYCYGVCTKSGGISGRDFDGHVENLALQEGVPRSFGFVLG